MRSDTNYKQYIIGFDASLHRMSFLKLDSVVRTLRMAALSLAWLLVGFALTSADKLVSANRTFCFRSSISSYARCTWLQGPFIHPGSKPGPKSVYTLERLSAVTQGSTLAIYSYPLIGQVSSQAFKWSRSVSQITEVNLFNRECGDMILRDEVRAASKVHSLTHTEPPLRSRLKEYGLITPFSTDSHGHFLSHLLSATHKQRVKREVFSSGESEQKLFFNITAFGKEFHLRLSPNSRLVAPGAMVEWHDEVQGFGNASDSVGKDASATLNQSESSGTERIVLRELLKTDCTFIGDITDVPGASVAINNCDGLTSAVCLAGADVGDINRWNTALLIPLLRVVFTYQQAEPLLDTCYRRSCRWTTSEMGCEKAGMIRTDSDEYFIEPLERGTQELEHHGRVHIVYRRSAMRQPSADVSVDYQETRFCQTGHVSTAAGEAKLRVPGLLMCNGQSTSFIQTETSNYSKKTCSLDTKDDLYNELFKYQEGDEGLKLLGECKVGRRRTRACVLSSPCREDEAFARGPVCLAFSARAFVWRGCLLQFECRYHTRVCESINKAASPLWIPFDFRKKKLNESFSTSASNRWRL
ncbi:A disintegrin and metalloproteinase with thrombospondin motifs 3 [Channa argus]|uniref:A disintegrin and metalloproteinase with thrombospondin motifs 3 n=1 Tax=Channa argus TaxID=215402 RepID=A0A6G1PZK7_CHAAH|nr:A disintegrin and metalloproteinase with thrombospondin motifs 3 [Channa argus]